MLADASESGEDSGKPTFQGRAGFTFPSPLGYKKTTVGVSGHWGEEEFDSAAATGAHSDVESWSVNLDVQQPVNEWLTIKGELFSGENLDEEDCVKQSFNGLDYEVDYIVGYLYD